MILESPDRAELHSENKHFKSRLLVVLRRDLTKPEFRLFTSQHHDVVVLALFDLFIAIKSHQNLFILGSYCCSESQINSADLCNFLDRVNIY